MDGNNTVVDSQYNIHNRGLYHGCNVVVYLLYGGISSWWISPIPIPIDRVELNKIRRHPHDSNILPTQYRSSRIIALEEDGGGLSFEESCKIPTGDAVLHWGVSAYWNAFTQIGG